MRYIYESDVLPARPHEAVEGFATLLKAKVSLLVELGGLNIYDHEVPDDKPPSGKWIVVRERIDLGGIEETASGLMSPMIQVMSESRESIHTPIQARAWHAGVQDIVLETLIGATVSVTTGRVDLIRRRQRPSPAAYDADDDTFYATSGFGCTMGPLIE
jgi:hypothetical protein